MIHSERSDDGTMDAEHYPVGLIFELQAGPLVLSTRLCLSLRAGWSPSETENF